MPRRQPLYGEGICQFILRFDFKLPPGGNNGVGIRSPLKGEPTFNGMEIQILDDGHEMYKGWLKPWQVHGSIYGVVSAKRGFLKPTGQWNQEEILADGPHIKVTLNGTVITDADLSKIEKSIDDHDHPGLHNAKGYISWLGHASNPPIRWSSATFESRNCRRRRERRSGPCASRVEAMPHFVQTSSPADSPCCIMGS